MAKLSKLTITKINDNSKIHVTMKRILVKKLINEQKAKENEQKAFGLWCKGEFSKKTLSYDEVLDNLELIQKITNNI